jgi:hypothetical protein
MTWTQAASRSLSQPPRGSGMCEQSVTAENVRAATPHLASGNAVDPITLKPVDEVVVTTLVDNVYDALLADRRRSPELPSQPESRRHRNSSPEPPRSV